MTFKSGFLFCLLVGSVACSAPDGGTDGSLMAGPAIGSVPFTVDSALDAAQTYRLVVVFTQLDDDFARPLPDVVYDVPFDPQAKLIELPRLSVPNAGNFLCVRKAKQRGQPPGACDADSPYKIAIGMVAIVVDANKDGKANLYTTTPERVVRQAMGAIVYDERGGSVLPTLIDGPVPAGGTLYETYRPNGNRFDQLRPRNGALLFTTKGPSLS